MSLILKTLSRVWNIIKGYMECSKNQKLIYSYLKLARLDGQEVGASTQTLGTNNLTINIGILTKKARIILRYKYKLQ